VLEHLVRRRGGTPIPSVLLRDIGLASRIYRATQGPRSATQGPRSARFLAASSLPFVQSSKPCQNREPAPRDGNTMNTYRSLAQLLLTLSPAHAGEMTELQAASINLAGFEGVVYYTNAADGYHLVATIAEGEAGMPVRFEATLADAQKVTISVPGKL